MTHLSRDENIELLQLAEMTVPPGLYKHYKEGDLYRVIGHCLLETTELAGVQYHAEDDPEIVWVRPLMSFVERVGTDRPRPKRFTKVSE